MWRADAEFGDLQAALHVAAGVGQGLSMLAAQRLGQPVHVAIEQPDELHQNARAPLRIRRRPSRLGFGGGCHCGIHLFLRGKRHLGNRLA